MIAGTVLFVGTISLIFIIYLKLKFITEKNVKNKQKSILRITSEFAIAFVIWLLFIYAQLTYVTASTEQNLYLGNVYEASQYLSLASTLLPIIFFLSFLEILVSIKIFTTRGRLLPDVEE